jgi:hypothetical protein
MQREARIIFLHHSTGHCIWNGGVADWFTRYNAANKAAFRITEQAFPKAKPYGWANYPYDYWNIWVNHAGAAAFQEEPTLEMLTAGHDVIVWKHCFPVSSVKADTGKAEVASAEKRLENYQTQYAALMDRMHSFPKTKFIVWTAAALTRNNTNEGDARRAKAFVDWTVKQWDASGDNVFLWDFNSLETEGGLYLTDKHAANPDDSHPNEAFSRAVAPLFCRRIVDVVEGRGDKTSLTGT